MIVVFSAGVAWLKFAESFLKCHEEWRRDKSCDARSALVCRIENGTEDSKVEVFQYWNSSPHVFLSLPLVFNRPASHLKIGGRLLTSVLSVTYQCCLNSYKSICVRTASAMQAQGSRFAEATSRVCWLGCPARLSGWERGGDSNRGKQKRTKLILPQSSLILLSIIWSP